MRHPPVRADWPAWSSPSPRRGSNRQLRNTTVCVCVSIGSLSALLLLLLSGVLLRDAGVGVTHGLRGLHQLRSAAETMSDADMAAAIKRQHPINRLQCGNWMQPYAKLHKAILTGKAPQRYALMRSLNEWENGLADRLASSVGILLYAILTGRAFQYDYEGDPPLWEGLRSEFIDWRYTGWDKGNESQILDYVAEHNSEPEFISFFAEQDLTEIGEDKHSVVWYTDHVVVYNAFENPYLKSKLAAMGLQQDTAFACLFDFLYRPTADVVAMVKPQLPVLLSPETVKIGIQIRVGDWQLVSSDRYWIHPQKHVGLFEHYFECATQVERAVARRGAGVVWYVLTDMAELRGPLAAKYPDRILVKADVETIEHTVKSDSHSRSGLLMALGELWAFSLTDWHVITRKSGFGKVGAMVNSQFSNHIFTIDYPMQAFNLWGLGGPAFDNRKVINPWQYQRSCSPEDADLLSKVCADFTGC